MYPSTPYPMEPTTLPHIVVGTVADVLQKVRALSPRAKEDMFELLESLESELGFWTDGINLEFFVTAFFLKIVAPASGYEPDTSCLTALSAKH